MIHSMTFLLVVASAAATDSSSTSSAQCVPECRMGYSCVDGQCISQCNPSCGSNERCVETSSGFQCTARAAVSTGEESRRYRQSARIPAITLGTLSLLGAIGSFALAGSAAGDETIENSSGTAAVFAVNGVIALGLGLWGVIGGARAGYVDQNGNRVR